MPIGLWWGYPTIYLVLIIYYNLGYSLTNY
nr:MAG TPA: hypothetical protein [Caudoviricetes sp.]DAN71820.1 MAG TPA: hypothetical protein [Caudoviricetes sp.]DAU73331.1 MAG TPA: hypothetical protein [Caudoviricetes sp.]